MATTEVAVPEQLLDVIHGELLPANIENARRVLLSAREMKQRLQNVIDDATAYVVEESKRNGVKTFHTPDGDITLSGGPTIDYDHEALTSLLREAGCPEERLDALVKVKIEYSLDRNVLRQLTGANEDYKAAAQLAEVEVLKPYRATAK